MAGGTVGPLYNSTTDLDCRLDGPRAGVSAFRDATAAGWNAYLADPAPANALLLAANPQLTPALVDCVVRKQAPFVTGTDGVGAMTAARWNELAAALRSIGQEVKVEGAWKDLGGTTAEPAPARP